jgi:predicted porin
MQKKLLAVAVAGALFSPLAMAQSSVTISGVFKVGIDNYRISNPTAARTGNLSETRVTDNSSRIIFGITEDLGGGMSAIGQLDVRPQLDDAGENNVAAGNSWVGVRSSSMGTLTFGRHDLHYGKQPDDTAALAGALMASSVSLMDYINGGAIAVASRSANVIRYDTPNWSGFAMTVAYSTNLAQESDLNSTSRKGNAWNFNPSFTSGPFQVGASIWRAKLDGFTPATINTTTGALVAAVPGAVADQDGLSLYGYYRLGAFKVGVGINDSETEAAGVVTGDRRAFTVPASWTSGPHNVAGHYTRAGDNKAVAGDDGAKMMAVAYSYSLSKRTSMGVTYARLTNDAGASYNFFTNTSSSGGNIVAGFGNVGLGSNNAALGAGEDGRLLAFTVRHAF